MPEISDVAATVAEIIEPHLGTATGRAVLSASDKNAGRQALGAAADDHVHSNYVMSVNHGDDADFPRPEGVEVVYWVGTVYPNNKTPADFFQNASPLRLNIVMDPTSVNEGEPFTMTITATGGLGDPAITVEQFEGTYVDLERTETGRSGVAPEVAATETLTWEVTAQDSSYAVVQTVSLEVKKIVSVNRVALIVDNDGAGGIAPTNADLYVKTRIQSLGLECEYVADTDPIAALNGWDGLFISPNAGTNDVLANAALFQGPIYTANPTSWLGMNLTTSSPPATSFNAAWLVDGNSLIAQDAGLSTGLVTILSAPTNMRAHANVLGTSVLDKLNGTNDGSSGEHLMTVLVTGDLDKNGAPVPANRVLFGASSAVFNSGGTALLNTNGLALFDASLKMAFGTLEAPPPPPDNVSPVAAFSSVVNELIVTLDGTASVDPDGAVVSYAWTFGDGGTATGSTTQHTYSAGGSYQVALTVTDDDGATNTITKTIFVAEQSELPVVMLSLTDPTANRTTLENASLTYDQFVWDAPGTGKVQVRGTVDLADRCNLVLAKNKDRVIEQTLDDCATLLRKGSGENAKSCGAVSGGSTTLSGISGHTLVVGDIIFVFSLDPLKANGKSRLGDLVKVTATASSSVTVDKPFSADMTNSPKYARLNLAPAITIDGGVWQHANPLSQWFREIFAFSTCKNPVVTENTTVQWGVVGISSYLVWEPDYRGVVRYMIDDQNGDGYNDPLTGARKANPTKKQLYGYAYALYGANRDVKISGSGGYCRHYATLNSASGKQKVNDTYPIECGDTNNVDFSADIARTTSTPISTHEGIGWFVIHDCDITDGGLYWELYDSRIGAENADYINQRSNTRIERVRMRMINVPGKWNYGVVAQDFLGPDLDRPRIELDDVLISNVQRGVICKNGVVDGWETPGGSIDVSNTTIEVGYDNGFAIMCEAGEITGDNIVIRAINGAAGVLGVWAQPGTTINLTNVRFEGISSGKKTKVDAGGHLTITENQNATGSTMTN